MWLVLAVFLVAAGGGAWWWFSRERPVEVETATVSSRQAGTQAAVLNASGYVTARRRATVSSKITGKVVEVNVEEGMAVTRGPGARAARRCARHARRWRWPRRRPKPPARNVRESEVRLARGAARRSTATSELSPTSCIDRRRRRRGASRGRLARGAHRRRRASRCAWPSARSTSQQTDLDNTVIRAPFSGVAISKDAQPGEMVSPVSAGGGFTRTGICTIVDMRSLEIEVDVNESYINRVQAGQQVTAVLDAYPDWQIPAHVITIVPTADRQKATVLVRIGFEQLDPRILPDMGVKVTFLRDAERRRRRRAAQPVTLVPKAAVRTENGQQPTCSSSPAIASSGAPSGLAAPTATRRSDRRASTPASAWSSRRRRTLGTVRS